jgi:hypothetical protein
MRHLSTLLFLLVQVTLVPLFAAQGPPQEAHPHKKGPRAKPIAEVTIDKLVDAMPAPTQPPPTPEQGPSSPPEVSFQGGQLVIVARNSTMGDVLNAVKQKTGASVEMPAVSSERVAGKFGPGAPRDVMAQLLNGSHYDYVLLGSPADPGALKKVVLMARVSGPQQANTTQPRQPPGRQNPAFQNPSYQQQEDQNLQAVPEVENDQPPVEENNPDASQDVPPPEEEQPPPDQAQPGQPPMVKTPEQLLRDLQQQQQQQQQEQNGQQGPPGEPPQ